MLVVGAVVLVVVGWGSCCFLVVYWVSVVSVELSCPDAAALFWGSAGGYFAALSAGVTDAAEGAGVMVAGFALLRRFTVDGVVEQWCSATARGLSEEQAVCRC